jgi:hypothetical protein
MPLNFHHLFQLIPETALPIRIMQLLPLHFASSLSTCSGASIVLTPHTTVPLHIVLSHSVYSGTTVACIPDMTAIVFCIICFALFGLCYVSCSGLHFRSQVDASDGLSASHTQAVEVPLW